MSVITMSGRSLAIKLSASVPSDACRSSCPPLPSRATKELLWFKFSSTINRFAIDQPHGLWNGATSRNWIYAFLFSRLTFLIAHTHALQKEHNAIRAILNFVYVISLPRRQPCAFAEKSAKTQNRCQRIFHVVF